MEPVDQTIFTPDSGNCFAACIASILERPLWTVPNFCLKNSPDPMHWSERYMRWMHSQGYFTIGVKMEELGKTVNAWLPGALCIMAGKSPRGEHAHAVVGRFELVGDARCRFEYVHDPHPSRDFIEDVKELDFIMPMHWMKGEH